jgi:hypothetical protein
VILIFFSFSGEKYQGEEKKNVKNAKWPSHRNFCSSVFHKDQGG